MSALYVIEARTPDGQLDLASPQPHEVFGQYAITGIDLWRMSQVIYRHVPDAVLTGDRIAVWPAVIDPRWIARRKTW